MSDERMRRVVRGHEDAGSNRLLSQVIIQNPLLDTLHHVTPKIANNRQIHAGIHQTKRIASSNDTIKRRQILEPPEDNLDLWMRTEPPAKDVGELLASSYENQLHSCWLE